MHPALKRGNLTAYLHAHVPKVLFEGTRAVGVRYERNGQVHEVYASREIIISAGAIKSPQILLLSGISNAEEPGALGIGVIADLPGVGENLQDHLLASVTYEAKQPLAAPNHQMLESPLFWKSDPRLLVPDLQPLFMHLPYYAPGFEGPSDAHTLCAGIIRPASRGSIMPLVTSGNPNAPSIMIGEKAADMLEESAQVIGQVRAQVVAAEPSVP